MISRIGSYLQGITIFFLTLTGFAQMPIFKRYYIADIPGFGWLADFYVTHVIHYLFAAVLIAILSYRGVELFSPGSKKRAMTGLIWGIPISGLIVSGGLMVIRNLPNVFFSHGLIIALNLSHLFFCMLFLGVLGLGAVFPKRRNVAKKS